MSDDTLAIEKLRAAMRLVGDPLPDLIVSIYALPEKPIEYRGHVFLTPDDAKTIHAKAPLILTQILGPASGRYRFALPFGELFQIELRLPPFEVT